MTRVSLLKKEDIAQKTVSFYFAKPSGYTYKPGQFTEITLIDPADPDETGEVHEFTIASAPSETHLMVTMRMRESMYKKRLASLSSGEEVELTIPYGNFVLPDDQSQPIVMISGGIGITPFRSMFIEETFVKSTRPLILFSFNKTAQDAAFLTELQSIAQQNKQVAFVPVMTRDDHWPGKTGYVTRELLQEYVTELASPLFYLSGSAAFLSRVSQALLSSGISPEQIRVDEFAGY
jgi:ferredoxin-NADP reductase